MAGASVRCCGCSYQADPADFSADGAGICRGCRRPLRVALFPALWHPPAAAQPETLIDTAEASCFNHPNNRAAVACDGCGRFLCALCDIEVQGQHLCPACVQAGVQKKKVTALDHSRVIYGKVAFYLSVGPLLMWPMTFLTAPTALFIAIRYWKRPGSLTGRGDSHAYHVFAILFALLQIAGWIALLSLAFLA